MEDGPTTEANAIAQLFQEMLAPMGGAVLPAYIFIN
jgi:hypothetical protein